MLYIVSRNSNMLLGGSSLIYIPFSRKPCWTHAAIRISFQDFWFIWTDCKVASLTIKSHCWTYKCEKYSLPYSQLSSNFAIIGYTLSSAIPHFVTMYFQATVFLTFMAIVIAKSPGPYIGTKDFIKISWGYCSGADHTNHNRIWVLPCIYDEPRLTQPPRLVFISRSCIMGTDCCSCLSRLQAIWRTEVGSASRINKKLPRKMILLRIVPYGIWHHASE